MLYKKFSQPVIRKKSSLTLKKQPVKNPSILKLKNFVKNQLKDQSYVKTFDQRLSGNSVLYFNRLTKRNFSVTDSSFARVVPMNYQVPSLKVSININKRQSQKSFLPKTYQKSFSLNDISHISQQDRSFFPTSRKDLYQIAPKLQNIKRDRIKSLSNVQMISGRQKFVKHSHLKFKLLQKQPKILKSATQRRISRLDVKISQLKRHQNSMRKIVPEIKIAEKPQAIRGKGQIVQKFKIQRLIDKIIKLTEMYFGMYPTPSIVGAYFKNLQGFNSVIKSIFMANENEAKRFTNASDLQKLFWVFKSKHQRPQFFGEEDLVMYKQLNNFSMKIQSKLQYQQNKFQQFQTLRINQQHQKLKKSVQLTARLGSKPNPKIQKITQFLQKKIPPKTDRKQENMKELQDLGVKFNFKERGRDIAMQFRQKAIVKQSNQIIKII